ILVLDPQFSIDLQLIGGVIILQTLPALVLSLYTRWFHRSALLVGWAVGMAAGIWMLWITPAVNVGTGQRIRPHWGGAQFALSHWGFDTKVTVYTGIVAVLLNLLVAAILTPFFRGRPAGDDQTRTDDYYADAGEPGVRQLPAEAGIG
ncbi:MAG: solute:Na+ symporter, family, partial [Mycobacteriales bacterium]